MNKKDYLLFADGFSIFGGWIDFIVILTIATFKFSINPFEISILSAAMLLPSIVLVGVIGKVSNSNKAIHYLNTSLLLRSIIGIAIVFSNSLILFSFFVVLRSIFNSFTLPLIQTVTAKSISSEDRVSYYSSLNMINSISKILAPALGGIISSFYSGDFSLILSSLLTFISFVMFFRLRNRLYGFKEEINKNNTINNVSKISPDEKIIWSKIIPNICIFFLFVFMINNQLPIILKEIKMNESSLGLLISSSAIGNFLYGMYKLKFEKNNETDGSGNELTYPILFIMIIFLVIGFLIYFDVVSIYYLMFLFFISGIFSSKFSIILSLYLSTYMIKSFGYVSSKLQAIQNIIIMLAPFIGAFILVHYNSSLVFIFSGLVGILSLILCNFFVKYILFEKNKNIKNS